MSKTNNSLMDNKAFKQARLNSFDGTQLTENTYNLTIGAVLIWGILINYVMARYFTAQILALPMIAVLIVYFAGSIGSMLVVYKSDNPAVSFLGFTGLAIAMGLLLTFYVSMYAQADVSRAFLMTAIVTVAMILISSIWPAVFLSIGRGLLIALILSIVVELAGVFLFHSAMNIMDYVVAGIFCGYIGFDWAKSQVYPKTLDNAVDSAADIYVDIVNLFIRILSIMGRSKD